MQGNPRSGLVKRAFFLRTIDKEKSVILETGDIFDVYPDEFLSDYILESYLVLGYDAIAIGDQEFSNGTDYLHHKISQYPLISNNLSILAENGNPEKIPEHSLRISRGGLNIAIISVTDPEVFRFYTEEITQSIKVEDPSVIISNILRQTEVQRTDIRVLLFHGTLENARKLARENPSLNIIIAGHEQHFVDGEMVGDIIIVFPGAEGNSLGHLFITYSGKDLIYKNSFIEFDYMIDPDDEKIRSRIDGYNKTMTEKLKTD